LNLFGVSTDTGDKNRNTEHSNQTNHESSRRLPHHLRHTLQLARAVELGVKSVAAVEAVLRRAPEFPHVEKELEARDGYATKIWKDQKDIQPCTLDDLCEADGFVARFSAEDFKP
jgi:hypothetical protein